MQKQENRESVIIKTSIVGVVVNIFLAFGKILVGFIANSIAFILDGVNNFTDVLSSLIAIVGTKLSMKPADKKHPFGHGRIEYLATMIVAVIILYAGFTSVIESVKKIIKPSVPQYSVLSLVIIGAAVFVKIFLGLFVKARGKKTNSGTLAASGQDALFDSIISASTLVAAFIFFLTGKSFEPWLALVISGFIIKSGIELILQAVSQILGERIESDLAKSVKKTVVAVDPEITGAYDLTLNNYGPNYLMGSIHVEVPMYWNAEKIDIVTRRIQEEVYKKHNVILSAVGIYSVDSENDVVAKIKDAVYKIAENYSEIIQIHGFFADTKKKRISFDAVISFEAKDALKIYTQFSNEVMAKFPDYSISIQMDADISD